MPFPYVVPVLIFGAGGAVSRYLLDGFIGSRFPAVLPRGTFLINVTGSLLLGLLTGLVLWGHGPAWSTDVLGTGFCGAYTTFSTFTFESMRLIEDGHYRQAVLNIGGSLVLGLGAAAAGLAVGAWL
ncbi:MAG: fluoride efflux transporter FluC [Acidimicrobiales bacterium]